jgi:CubicO group peptidase (beta-lactamase class C family)
VTGVGCQNYVPGGAVAGLIALPELADELGTAVLQENAGGGDIYGGELARFMEALFGGELLDEAMMAAMFEPQIVGASHAHIGKPGYGLGVMVDADGTEGLVAGHGGGGPGYGAAAFAFEEVGERRVVAVALANGDRGDVAMAVVFALRGLVGGG